MHGGTAAAGRQAARKKKKKAHVHVHQVHVHVPTMSLSMPPPPMSHRDPGLHHCISQQSASLLARGFRDSIGRAER